MGFIVKSDSYGWGSGFLPKAGKILLDDTEMEDYDNTQLLVDMINDKMSLAKIQEQMEKISNKNTVVPYSKGGNVVSVTALSFAVCKGREDVVGVLLQEDGIAVEGVSNDGVFSAVPLMEAVKANSLNLVNMLIKAKANLNYVTNFEGSTPLLIAATRGYKDIVKALILGGADVSFASARGILSADEMALSSGGVDIAEALNESVVDARQSDGFATTETPVEQVMKSTIAENPDPLSKAPTRSSSPT